MLCAKMSCPPTLAPLTLSPRSAYVCVDIVSCYDFNLCAVVLSITGIPYHCNMLYIHLYTHRNSLRYQI